MSIEIFNIVGIRSRDVSMPGKFYLSEEGDLTIDLKRAKLIPEAKIDMAIKEVKAFSPHYFREEVIPFYG